ncbi:hypothetical protein AV530_018603 [Patagioenas fasciata monilis]|uniref:Uncharacterized protein n=1 Tax=Patagioenas fasciata monilis TaxID=372326 RepID=A0A1V4L1P4_PATFA|nr:hypothetical protein AV530_018603 [Patagioenas fasciata monilis]
MLARAKQLPDSYCKKQCKTSPLPFLLLFVVSLRSNLTIGAVDPGAEQPENSQETKRSHSHHRIFGVFILFLHLSGLGQSFIGENKLRFLVFNGNKLCEREASEVVVVNFGSSRVPVEDSELSPEGRSSSRGLTD